MWKGEWFAEEIFQSFGSLDAEISKGIGLLSGKERMRNIYLVEYKDRLMRIKIMLPFS